MRALIFGIWLGLVSMSAESHANDSFEFLGLKPGMTVDQVKQAIEKNNLGTPNIWRAPSFQQQASIAKNKLIHSNSFEGIQRIRSETSAYKTEVIFVAMPEGAIASKISVDVFTEVGTPSLLETFTEKYGQPLRKTDLEWVWGDSAAYAYARSKPYLEVQPRPASIGARKPIAAVILDDPTRQKAAKDILEREKGR